MTLRRPPALTLNAWMRWPWIRRVLGDEPRLRVLEIGPGGGAMGAMIARRHEYVGVEPDPIAFARTRQRLEELGHGEVLNGSIEALAGRSPFDVVCAFEVLEHIEDDVAALEAWFRWVRPGGRIVLSVPAWQHRWGPLDLMAGHIRRYSPESLRSSLEAAGFIQPTTWLYGFPLGYLLQPLCNAAASRAEPQGTTQEQTGASGRWLQPPEALAFVTRAASWPFRLAQRPFAHTRLGTGIVAVARRPDAGLTTTRRAPFNTGNL
jgi:SAM-dependent methyltransferase